VRRLAPPCRRHGGGSAPPFHSYFLGPFWFNEKLIPIRCDSKPLDTCREAGFQFSGDLLGHSGVVAESHFALPDEPHVLHSCAADGTVRGWDVRSGQQTERFDSGGAPLQCCHSNGTLVAAGGRDNVLFWDRRTGRPAASFSDTHAQDVVQVRFHPEHRAMLVSGSEDGLIAVFDTAGGIDEEEGFSAALNIGTAVAKLGFYGPSGDRLWCCSGTETLHLWEWRAACSEDGEGGVGALAEATDAREALAGAAAAARPSGAPLAEGVDYLLGCEFEASSGGLFLAAGTYDGAAGLFPVREPERCPGGSPAAALFGVPSAVMAGTHTDVVRSLVWAGAGKAVVTGGEDSTVCAWAAAAGAGPTASGSSGDSAARRGTAHTRRVSPY
jgi:WD repeat-containing protein 89